MTPVELLQQKYKDSGYTVIEYWVRDTHIDLTPMSAGKVLVHGIAGGIIAMLQLAAGLGCTREEMKFIAEHELKPDKKIWPVIELLLDQQSSLIDSHKEVSNEDNSHDSQPEKEMFPDKPVYSLETCAQNTSLNQETLERWIKSIKRKGQAVLYGPPGTGKTYMASHLADHLIGGGDGFVDLVQFHPTYSYEDFIQGIRPQARKDGGLDYPMVPGRFLEFCNKAKNRTGCCVLIIDEINRANLPRVFGELMYLLEYRDKKIPLSGGEKFSIPSNVLLIGTMNTADRSIVLVDSALRRRFTFLELYPNFDVLEKYHSDKGFLSAGLIEALKLVNKRIGNNHYQIGISFFLVPDIMCHIEDIWRMEIEPYLEEYFFDQASTVDELRWEKVMSKVIGE